MFGGTFNEVLQGAPGGAGTRRPVPSPVPPPAGADIVWIPDPASVGGASSPVAEAVLRVSAMPSTARDPIAVGSRDLRVVATAAN